MDIWNTAAEYTRGCYLLMFVTHFVTCGMRAARMTAAPLRGTSETIAAYKQTERTEVYGQVNSIPLQERKTGAPVLLKSSEQFILRKT